MFPDSCLRRSQLGRGRGRGCGLPPGQEGRTGSRVERGLSRERQGFPRPGRGLTQNIRVSAGLPLHPKSGSGGPVGPLREGRGSLGQACGNLRRPFPSRGHTRDHGLTSEDMLGRGLRGAWCRVGGQGSCRDRGNTWKFLRTRTSLERKFPPSVLKPVPCPELWPSLPLRDTAQSSGESPPFLPHAPL